MSDPASERRKPGIGRRRLLTVSALSVGAGVLTAAASAVGIVRLAQADRSTVPSGPGDPTTALPSTSTLEAQPTATAGEEAISAMSSAGASASNGFVHPGMLHTQADFDRIAAKVTAAAQPWQAGMDRLAGNGHSQSTWRARPLRR